MGPVPFTGQERTSPGVVSHVPRPHNSNNNNNNNTPIGVTTKAESRILLVDKRERICNVLQEEMDL